MPKFTQRMTVQRSELITYASPRQETNVIRNRSQRPYSNGDDVFFGIFCKINHFLYYRLYF